MRRDLQARFGVAPADLVPTVYFRITDNWLELMVRFLVSTHGIGVASATYGIVGFPPIKLPTSAPADAAPRAGTA